VAVSALEVSVTTGPSGPVVVLAGEADVTSADRLDEALAAQVGGRAVKLTIDATDLRYADSASMRTLLMAAVKITADNGSVTLLNPQPPVARLLDLLRVDGMITVERLDPARGPGQEPGEG
jgi:anti-anti-sigma factor